MKGTK